SKNRYPTKSNCHPPFSPHERRLDFSRVATSKFLQRKSPAACKTFCFLASPKKNESVRPHFPPSHKVRGLSNFGRKLQKIIGLLNAPAFNLRSLLALSPNTCAPSRARPGIGLCIAWRTGQVNATA